jgi:hypothetical protein
MADYQFATEMLVMLDTAPRFTAGHSSRISTARRAVLETRLRYGETGLGPTSLSPHFSSACAILSSVAVKLRHWPEARLVPQPAPAITIPDFLVHFQE